MEINTSFQFLFIEAGQRDTFRAPFQCLVSTLLKGYWTLFSQFSKKIIQRQPKYSRFLYVRFLKPTYIFYLEKNCPCGCHSATYFRNSPTEDNLKIRLVLLLLYQYLSSIVLNVFLREIFSWLTSIDREHHTLS